MEVTWQNEVLTDDRGSRIIDKDLKSSPVTIPRDAKLQSEVQSRNLSTPQEPSMLPGVHLFPPSEDQLAVGMLRNTGLMCPPPLQLAPCSSSLHVS